VKTRLLHIIIIALGLGFAYACKKSQPLPPVDLHYEYLPIEPGHWILYSVDSTVWDDFTQTETFYSYILKEVFESEFIDLEGRPSTRIERYVQFHDTLPFTLRDVWYATATPTRVEKLEENQRFIKMVFPVKDKARWNGNAMNNLPEANYEIRDAHQPALIGNNLFDSTAYVLHVADTNLLIKKDFAYEIYAKHTGLVFKKFLQITTQVDGTIIKGVDYTYTYMGSGHN